MQTNVQRVYLIAQLLQQPIENTVQLKADTAPPALDNLVVQRLRLCGHFSGMIAEIQIFKGNGFQMAAEQPVQILRRALQSGGISDSVKIGL